MHSTSFQRFSDADSCLQQLAADICTQLQQTLAAQADACLLLPGGSSPQRLLPLLAQADVAWSRVLVSPTDERWVPVDDPQSNLRLLRSGLPQARLLDPRQSAESTAAAKAWAEQLQGHLPLAVVLLGMGDDGHFASLFPQMPGLAEALDIAHVPSALVGYAPAEPRLRLTLNLSLLLRSSWLGLLVFGQRKATLLEQVLRNEPSSRDLPIHRLLWQQQLPVRLYWAP